MKLGIVGLGVIGKAVQDCAGCETIGADRGDSLNRMMSADAIAVCVGTPCVSFGDCDTRALASVLDTLIPYQGLIVCHSTAPPAFYAAHARSNLVHVPEFVRTEHAAEEYRRQERMVIGGEAMSARVAYHMWRKWICPHLTDYRRVTIQSAAMIKYTANVLLATKVALLNELKPLSEASGATWDEVISVLSDDPRLGTSHWRVPGPDGKPGFGGTCLPKDLSALIALCETAPTPSTILSAVRASNLAVRYGKEDALHDRRETSGNRARVEAARAGLSDQSGVSPDDASGDGLSDSRVPRDP